MEVIQNFIDGKLVAPLSGEYLDVFEPAKGSVFAQVPNSTEVDLELAIQAASRAFPAWAHTAIAERSRLLHRLADLIEQNLEALAKAESKDSGKPLSLARRMDIPRAAANFRFFGSAIVSFASEAHINEGHSINYTRRAPLGVVGCISPWNLPLYLFTWKIAPALAAGNCVVAKPSEITPYTAFLLASLVQQAGFPAGVLNILHGLGSGIGAAMAADPRIVALSFTGGTDTGRKIASAASNHFKKLSLELGGKNPVLIFDDCDLAEAVKTTVRSSFTNQGEICLCGSRVLVQRTIYDRFKSLFLEEVKNLVVGDPIDDRTDLGAVVSLAHLERISGFVERARAGGQVVLTGGQRLKSSGYFYEPTVIETSSSDCEINQVEVFGPVVTIMPFEDEGEALVAANSTVYGLAAVIWTSDLTRAHRVAHALKSGIVWVNTWMERDLRTPFGGMKSSGMGREGGNEALRFFTEPQNICIKL